jgi:hypothetical protein
MSAFVAMYPLQGSGYFAPLETRNERLWRHGALRHLKPGTSNHFFPLNFAFFTLKPDFFLQHCLLIFKPPDEHETM